MNHEDYVTIYVCCPKCGAVYQIFKHIIKDIEPCRICGTITLKTEPEYKTDYIYDLVKHNNRQAIFNIEDNLRTRYCLNSPLFDQAAWDKRVASEKGTFFDKDAYLEDGTFIGKEQSTPIPKPKPQCPYCNSTNVKKISSLNRTVSALAWGLGSSKIGKSFECLDCKGTF